MSGLHDFRTLQNLVSFGDGGFSQKPDGARAQTLVVYFGFHANKIGHVKGIGYSGAGFREIAGLRIRLEPNDALVWQFHG